MPGANTGKQAGHFNKSLLLSLGHYRAFVETALQEMEKQEISERIWAHDHTVWKADPEEIANRLGWLHCPENMLPHLAEIDAFVDEVRAAAFTHAVLVGMGGSSLAPEVFRRLFGVRERYLDLAVLDSTDPDAVVALERQLDLTKTLFIVSTKSGGTVETLSLFKYFYTKVLEKAGKSKAGEQFVAITDPGSALEDAAGTLRFRKIFRNDPNIGGRYSALSFFGLVPAALIGVDLQELLKKAQAMADLCRSGAHQTPRENPGALLGAILGELALRGRDKVTFVLSPRLKAFGVWAEQLIAESTGKENKGILPVATETVATPDVYGPDRLFVHLRLGDEDTGTAAIRALVEAGHPVVQARLDEIGDLGAAFFKWEFATSVAGWRLGINPFDQPNVESAKVLARKMVAEYQQKGELPSMKPTLKDRDITAYARFSANNLKALLQHFIARAHEGNGESRSYIAIQAFFESTPANDAALQVLAAKLRDRYTFATTIGYGPRFLHSTGQLHKGDSGNGLFIQLTARHAEDVPIPDQPGSPESSISFGVLIQAQALGDLQALINNKRPLIRIDLGANAARELQRLAELV